MKTISQETISQIREFGGTMKHVFEALAETIEAVQETPEAAADVQTAAEARFDEPGGRKGGQAETKPPETVAMTPEAAEMTLQDVFELKSKYAALEARNAELEIYAKSKVRIIEALVKKLAVFER